jgi:hypothetical protein
MHMKAFLPATLGLVIAFAAGTGASGAEPPAANEAHVTNNAPIPAMGLSSALNIFAKNTGLQLVYVSKVASDVKTRGAPGGLNSEETLQKLLEGTDLKFRFVNPGTVTIYSESQSDSAVPPLLNRTVHAPQAKAADPAAAPSSPKTETAAGVEEIVVTARRLTETLQSAPLSVAALTSKKLEDMNVRTLLDVTNVPNVSVTPNPGFISTMQVSIRGIVETDPIMSNDQPIATYVDGVLIAHSIASQLNLIDPERIDILRGPQGSLFGRNTTGGAINITLPGPADQFGSSTRVGYASNNELTLREILDTGELWGTGLKAKFAIQRTATSAIP